MYGYVPFEVYRIWEYSHQFPSELFQSDVSLKKHTYQQTNKRNKLKTRAWGKTNKETKKQTKHVGEMGPFQLKNLKEKEFLSQYFQKTTISE